MWFWPFTREKTYKEAGLLNGMTDWHTHILPGVDDGVANMDDAVKTLKQYSHMDIREVWLTPHINVDMPNETDVLRKRFDELQQVYQNFEHSSEHHLVKIHLGGEYMLDSLLLERLCKRDILTLGDDTHLLLQLGIANQPEKLFDKIREIQNVGYVPILAHPERYLYMSRSDYHTLRKDMSVEFQLNLPSLVGLYGPEAMRRAKMLLEAGYYTYVGSDLHNLHKFYAAITEYKISTKHIELLREIVDSTAK